jgi:hypothetical protein
MTHQEQRDALFWTSLALCGMLLLISLATYGATLSWEAPTENCDGSALPADQLTKFTLHYGRTSRGTPVAACDATETFEYETSIDIDPGLRTYDVQPGEPGTWYFAMTATTAEGTSVYSNEAMKEVTLPVFALTSSSQEGAVNVDQVTLLVGETGKAVTVTWEGGTGTIELHVYEYGDEIPVLTGTADASALSWQFTPPRAGLFEVRLSFDGGTTWQRSEDLGWLYYFNLASPSGGGIN